MIVFKLLTVSILIICKKNIIFAAHISKTIVVTDGNVPSPHKIVLQRMTELRLFSLIVLLSLFQTATAHGQSEETVIGELEVIEDSTATLAEKGDGFLTGDELLSRLESVGSCVDLRVTDVVRGYIRNYVNRNSEKASLMLGRRLTYFPLYEEKMREYGVPEDLKYLSVVESALNAKAVSRVGATGLWQFMPSTGGEYEHAGSQ